MKMRVSIYSLQDFDLNFHLMRKIKKIKEVNEKRKIFEKYGPEKYDILLLIIIKFSNTRNTAFLFEKKIK
jgi:hypothetical protein